jgi:hypothetical protein
MKSIFITLSIVFISIISKGQNDFDSLSKYSYLVLGYMNGETYQNGTGFFIKTKDGYKFITAKHNVSCINTFTKQPLPNKYDFIGIVYDDTVTKSATTIKLDIRQVKPVLPNTFFYETPDIVILDIIGLKVNAIIYSVEKFIDTLNDGNKNFEKLIAYGYKKDTVHKTADSLKTSYYEGTFADMRHTNPRYSTNDSLNYVIQPEITQGMSGSPVFFKYSTNKNGISEEWIELGGVVFGNDTIYHSGYMIQTHITNREIEKAARVKFTFGLK